MTYGFCPEDWPRFHSEMEKRGIDASEIERVEMRPDSSRSSVRITMLLRSGGVEAWTQSQEATGLLDRGAAS